MDEVDPGHPYRDLVEAYRRAFRTDDTGPLDVSLAAILTAGWEGEPLWGFIVAPPSSGKTATLQLFQKDKDGSFFRNTLTPHALVSGLKREQKDLLPRLDGKCLIVKDFTSILTMHREGRDEILGDLRAIFDGDFAKSFGSDVGDKEYASRFNVLAAVTPVIELHYSVDSVLGQRFVMVRMALPREYDSDAEREPEAVRAELQEKVLALLRERRSLPFDPELTEDQVRECKALAVDVATLRTEVPRDQKGDLKMMPAMEGPSRLTNQFEKVACGVAFARAHSEVLDEDMEIVRRVARDTVPSVRREVLVALCAGSMTVRDVCAITKLGDWEARRKLEDLHVLGVVSAKEEAQTRFYEIRETLRLFRSESPGVMPGPQALPGEAQSAAVPALFVVERASSPDYLRHTPGNDADGPLAGAKNLALLWHETVNRIRWHTDEPTRFAARHLILARQIPETPENLALLDSFVEMTRRAIS